MGGADNQSAAKDHCRFLLYGCLLGPLPVSALRLFAGAMAGLCSTAGCEWPWTVSALQLVVRDVVCISVAEVSGLESALEPLFSLCAGSVGEGVRNDAALCFFLQVVVADDL